MKIAVFPGSFDPITNGHVDIVMRSLQLFDKIIIAIGVNNDKKYMYPLEKRKDWIQKTFAAESKVSVDTYQGLTIDFCKQNNAHYIIRGLRSSPDFDFERGIAQMNHAMNPEIETLFFMTRPEFSAISSSIVRDIAKNKGDISPFVPEKVSKETV